MAARTRIREVTASEPAPPASEELEVVTPQIEPDDDPEADALAELRGLGGGGEYKYTVSRVSTEPGKKAGYCKTYTLGDLSPDNIREEFGGGKYRIRVTDAGGKYVTMTTLDIVDLPKSPTAQVAPAAPPGTDLAGIASILAAVKPAAGDGGISQILVAMIASQGEMMKAIANRQPDKGPSITEILAIINASNKKDDGGSLDTLLKGIELGKSLAGGGGEDDGMLGIARQGLELITPLVKEQATQHRPIAPVRPQPARIAPIPNATAPAPVAQIPNASAPAPVAPLNAPEGANVRVLQQLDWMRKQLNVLVHHASRQKDPELYAEVLLDNLPPFLTPAEIMEHVGSPDAVAKLAQLDGRVAQYAEWFEEFRAAIVEFLQPEDEIGEDEPEAPDAPGEVGGE